MEVDRLRSPEAALREMRLAQMEHGSREDRFLYLSCLVSFAFILAVRPVDRRYVCRVKLPECQKA